MRVIIDNNQSEDNGMKKTHWILNAIILFISAACASAEDIANGAICGRVYDESTGKGISGVTLKLNTQRWIKDVFTQTNAEGVYRFDKLHFGLWSVTLQASLGDNLQCPAHMCNVRNAITNEDVDFPITKALCMPGVVKDIDGNPLAGATIRPNSGYEEVISAEDGTFAMLLAKNDEYEVSATKPGYVESDTKIVTIGVKNLNILLEQGASISGIVVDANDKPIQDIIISTIENKSICELTNYEGKYYLGYNIMNDEPDISNHGYMRAGKYTLVAQVRRNYDTASNDDHEDVAIADANVEVKPGQELNNVKIVINDPPQYPSINGIVIDETDTSIEDVTIEASEENSGQVYYTKTNTHGEFCIPHLPEGVAIRIRAGKLGYKRCIKENVKADVKDLKMVCSKRAIIHLSVANEDGTPIKECFYSDSYIRMEEYDEETRLQIEKGEMPDGSDYIYKYSPDGIIEISPNHSGNERVWIKAPDYVPNSININIPEINASLSREMILKKSPVINGTVVDKNNKPVPYAPVFIGPIPECLREDPDMKYCEDYADTFANAQGHFRLDIVPDGCHAISAFGENQTGELQVEPKTGETLEVQIQIKEL